MESVILRTTATFVLPLLLMFSVIVLLRGHNEPGGGFVGGLLASAAFLLHMLATGTASTRRLIVLDPLTVAAWGLALALLSGVIGWFADGTLFDAAWTDIVLLREVKVGTPLLFDVGVYLTVSGVVIAIGLELSDAAGGVGFGVRDDGEGGAG